MRALIRLCIPGGKGRRYGFAVDRGLDAAEGAGVMVPAGNTPAPESGAAEAPGEG